MIIGRGLLEGDYWKGIIGRGLSAPLPSSGWLKGIGEDWQ